MRGQAVIHQPVITFRQALIDLFKQIWPNFSTRTIEIAVDYWMMSWLSRIDAKSSAAATMIMSTQLMVRSVPAASMYAAPLLFKDYEDPSHVGTISGYTALTATGLSVVFSLACLSTEHFLLAAGHPSEVAELTQQYMSAYASGLLFTFSYVGLQMVTLGLLRPRAVLLITLPVKALTVFLGTGLMYGRFGMPQMGVMGLGLANSLSSLTGVLIYCCYFASDPSLRKYQLLRPQLVGRGEVFLKLLGHCLRNGGYAAIELGNIWVMTLIIGKMGGAIHLASSHAAFQVSFVVSTVSYSVAQSMSIVVQRALSSGELVATIQRLIYLGTGLNFILPASALLIYLGTRIANSDGFVTIFLERSMRLPEVIRLAHHYSWVVLAEKFPDTLRNSMQRFLNAYGNTTHSIVTNVATSGLSVGAACLLVLALDQSPMSVLIMRTIAIATGAGVIGHEVLQRMRGNENSIWMRAENAMFSVFGSMYRGARSGLRAAYDRLSHAAEPEFEGVELSAHDNMP